MIIYRIFNLVTGKSYIGQSTYKTISERYSGNWYTNTHSRYLKNSVAKHGIKNFSVEILERDVGSVEELDKLEIHYIGKFNSIYPNGYNMTGGGDSIHRLHEETKRKIGERNARTYDFINHLGEEIHVVNLKKFCERNNLCYAGMKALTRNVVVSSHGFALKGTPKELIENKHIKYVLVNIETGKKECFEEISSFCRKHMLCKDAVWKLVNGYRLIPYKGWATEDMDLSIWNEKRRRSETFLRAPDGNIFQIDFNSTDFCKKHPPLDRADITALCEKTAIKRKGWTLAETTEEDLKRYRKKQNRSGIYCFGDNALNSIIEIQNLKQFCEQNNLSYSSMQKLAGGIIDRYGVYTFENTKRGRPQKTYLSLGLKNIATNEEVFAPNANQLWIKMRGKLAKNKMFSLVRECSKNENDWVLISKQTT